MLKLYRKQYSPEGNEELDTIAMTSWEEAYKHVQSLFKQLAHAAWFEETHQSNGEKYVTIKDRNRKIIYQLKTTPYHGKTSNVESSH